MEALMGFDLAGMIQAIGYVGLFAIIFAESGVLLGFFLPGDSLLFTAGFLASQGYGNIVILAAICFAAAVLGDSFGYAFGRRAGPRVFVREEGWLFRKAYVERMRVFFARWGGKAIVLARFTPVIRTFAPISAGIAGMPYRTFFFYNVTGGFLWAVGIVGLGYVLGNTIPNIDGFLLPLVGGIIVISLIPSAVEFFAMRSKRKHGGSK